MSVIYGNSNLPSLEHLFGQYLQASSSSAFTMWSGDKATAMINDGTLEWSNDAQHWNTWSKTGTQVLSSSLYMGKHRIFIRGTNNTVINPTASSGLYGWHFDNSGIKLSGNIDTLLDWKTAVVGGTPTMGAGAFQCLFALGEASNTITDLSDLIFPDRSLTADCYAYMFQYMQGLTSYPKILPAKTLTDHCYHAMFAYTGMDYGSSPYATYTFHDSGGINPPELPATTLADYCYSTMFRRSKIVKMPRLPATTLTNRCYYYMFEGCLWLAEYESLPATTLAEYCYHSMFALTSLKQIPRINATYFPAYSCYNMFSGGCGTSSDGNNYGKINPISKMFNVSNTQTTTCKNAYRIPYTGTGSAANTDNCISWMFNRHPTLWVEPANPSSSTISAADWYPTLNTTYYVNAEIG